MYTATSDSTAKLLLVKTLYTDLLADFPKTAAKRTDQEALIRNPSSSQTYFTNPDALTAHLQSEHQRHSGPRPSSIAVVAVTFPEFRTIQVDQSRVMDPKIPEDAVITFHRDTQAISFDSRTCIDPVSSIETAANRASTEGRSDLEITTEQLALAQKEAARLMRGVSKEQEGPLWREIQPFLIELYNAANTASMLPKQDLERMQQYIPRLVESFNTTGLTPLEIAEKKLTLAAAGLERILNANDVKEHPHISDALTPQLLKLSDAVESEKAAEALLSRTASPAGSVDSRSTELASERSAASSPVAFYTASVEAATKPKKGVAFADELGLPLERIRTIPGRFQDLLGHSL